jgi:phage-related protein
MASKWKIQLYETASGDKPVEDFIKSLNEQTQLKIVRAFDLLEEFGIHGVSAHVKKLTGASLWELRILGSNSIRILYVTVTERTFLLLHGFKKKTQKTPHREISTATKRLLDYKATQMKD